MDVAALIISIFAFVAAGVSALYTRSYAKTAAREVALGHEPHLVLEVRRSASISAPGRPTVGGGPELVLRNVGRGDALYVKAYPSNGGAPLNVGTLKAGRAVSLRSSTTSSTVKVEWKTIDLQGRSASLSPTNVR